MKINMELSLSYDDVLLVPQYSEIKSRTEVDLTSIISPHLVLKIPLISANMSDVTGIEMAVKLGELGGLGVLPRFMSSEDEADMVSRVKKKGLIAAAAVGLRNGMFDRAGALVKAGADVLFLDVAHGHMQQTIEATKSLKQKFGKQVDVISGNVATYQAAYDLFKAGADCVKVGVGPGSICTTRIETGFGVPQLTAVINAAKAARYFKKNIIADGGIKHSGDVVKALAAGASAVMAGNLFAGSSEAPGKIVRIKGQDYKQYFGSTSFSEKENHIKRNKKELNGDYCKHVEGVEGLVPAKGSVSGILEKMEANIRSGFSYAGARTIKDLWKKAEFIRITTMGRRESMAHDIITKF